MIFGNINQLEEFPYLEEAVKECFEYAKNNDILSYEKGCHEIDGDRLFVNVVEYTTTTQRSVSGRLTRIISIFM